MGDINWEEILRNSVVDNKIKAIYLKSVPQLKTCDDWGSVTFLGTVNYKFTYTHYDGALIKRQGRLYYINKKQLLAVATIMKWKTDKVIEVIKDDTEE